MLLLTELNHWFSPKEIWWFSFLGLGFPYLFIVNFCFAIFWLLQKKWWFLISIFALLFNFNNLQNSLAWSSEKSFSASDSSILKVMSFNVRVFDLYEYNPQKNNVENEISLLKKEHPQILCIQEFYTSESPKQTIYNMLSRLQKEAGYKYFHFYNSLTLRNTDHWGIAVFSDFEINQSVDIDFGKRTENEACYCDINIHHKTYRIVNTHLQSVYFGKRDYTYLDNLKLEDDEDMNAGKRILRKLKRGFVRRAQQAETVANIVAQSPYPIILCGDFNDTPASYSYHTISNNLQDAFLVSSNGIGTTYISRFPFLRIDYLMTDKNISPVKFKTLNEQILSDHYPIEAWLKLN